MRQPRTAGFPANVNAAFAAAAPADVVVLNSDCVVAAGWLGGHDARAAHSDALVATASALTNHGTILSVPERNRPHAGPAAGPTSRSGGRRGARAVAAPLPVACPRPSGTACTSAARRSISSAASISPSRPATARRSTSPSAACSTAWSTSPRTTCSCCTAPAARLRRTARRTRFRKQHERIIDARYPYYQRAQTRGRNSRSSGPLPRAFVLGAARDHGADRHDRRPLPRADSHRHAGAHAGGHPGVSKTEESRAACDRRARHRRLRAGAARAAAERRAHASHRRGSRHGQDGCRPPPLPGQQRRGPAAAARSRRASGYHASGSDRLPQSGLLPRIPPMGALSAPDAPSTGGRRPRGVLLPPCRRRGPQGGSRRARTGRGSSTSASTTPRRTTCQPRPRHAGSMRSGSDRCCFALGQTSVTRTACSRCDWSRH